MLENVAEKIQILQGRIDKMIERFEEETDLMIENIHVDRIDDGFWNGFVGCELEVKFRPMSNLRKEGIIQVNGSWRSFPVVREKTEEGSVRGKEGPLMALQESPKKKRKAEKPDDSV